MARLSLLQTTGQSVRATRPRNPGMLLSRINFWVQRGQEEPRRDERESTALARQSEAEGGEGEMAAIGDAA